MFRTGYHRRRPVLNESTNNYVCLFVCYYLIELVFNENERNAKMLTLEYPEIRLNFCMSIFFSFLAIFFQTFHEVRLPMAFLE